MNNRRETTAGFSFTGIWLAVFFILLWAFVLLGHEVVMSMLAKTSVILGRHVSPFGQLTYRLQYPLLVMSIIALGGTGLSFLRKAEGAGFSLDLTPRAWRKAVLSALFAAVIFLSVGVFSLVVNQSIELGEFAGLVNKQSTSMPK